MFDLKYLRDLKQGDICAIPREDGTTRWYWRGEVRHFPDGRVDCTMCDASPITGGSTVSLPGDTRVLIARHAPHGSQFASPD